MKKINKFLLIASCILFLIITVGTIRGRSLFYTVSVYETGLKLFKVECEIRDPKTNSLQLDWPIWTPGYVVAWYYGQHVSELKAFDQNGSPLNVRRVTDSRIYIDCNDAEAVNFNYLVHAIDPPENLGFAQAYLDSIQGWYNGAALFPEIEGFRDLPAKVKFELPPEWDLATGMLPDGNDGYIVKDYDELVDSPVQLGRFLSLDFTESGMNVRAAVAGNDSVDIDRLKNLLRTIVKVGVELMGDVPVNRFLFIFHVSSRGAGGLEHLNVTTISLRTEEYFKENSALEIVIAHEFFHIWNAKKIRVRTFERYDYSRPHRTKTVWFAEGVTAYYTDLILHRSNLYSKEEVYGSLEQILNLYENNPARKRLSWEDISWYIWEPEIRQGLEVWLLPGWMIDLKIRDLTNNVFSLDDVMRSMNIWYGKQGRGFEEDDLPRIISTVIQQDFSDFFQRHISGCEPFPYDDLFAAAGLERKVTTESVTSLGCRFGKMVDGRVKVVHLDNEVNADVDDLLPNDIILKINDIDRPTFEEVQRIQKNTEPGSTVTLLVDRNGIRHTLNVKVTTMDLIRSNIQETANPTARQLAIRQGILKGNTR